MEALIVAAGFGSRLRAVSPSKPLTPVAGVAMIDRVIAALRAGGGGRITVVTGHEAELLERHLHALDPAIRCVRVADPALANGHSVLAGAALIGPGRHLLAMADHLIDPAIVAALIAAPPAPVLLAVDRRLDNPRVDLADVTRVRTAGDRIVAIGKELADYDAFDCGVFAVDGRFHDALRGVLGAGGAGSISDGVTALASGGEARTLTIGDAWWIDVDDPAALARAEADLSGVPDVAKTLH